MHTCKYSTHRVAKANFAAVIRVEAGAFRLGAAVDKLTNYLFLTQLHP